MRYIIELKVETDKELTQQCVNVVEDVARVAINAITNSEVWLESSCRLQELTQDGENVEWPITRKITQDGEKPVPLELSRRLQRKMKQDGE